MTNNSQRKLDVLKEVYQKYLRWVAEGSLPYWHGYDGKDGKCQYFYDTYHERVKQVDGLDRFEFDIQTDDGPDGDTWWKGEFTVVGEGIFILKDTHYDT